MSREDRITEVRSVQHDPDHEQRVFTIKATEVIWLLFGILEVLIALRVVFKLIAANPGSPIVALIYSLTDSFVFPFAGITITPSFGDMVLEVPSLIAMVIYALIAWALGRLVWVLFYRPRGGVVEEVRETTSSEEHYHRH